MIKRIKAYSKVRLLLSHQRVNNVNLPHLLAVRMLPCVKMCIMLLSASIHDCLLAQVVGVDAVDLCYVSVTGVIGVLYVGCCTR